MYQSSLSVNHSYNHWEDLLRAMPSCAMLHCRGSPKDDQISNDNLILSGLSHKQLSPTANNDATGLCAKEMLMTSLAKPLIANYGSLSENAWLGLLDFIPNTWRKNFKQVSLHWPTDTSLEPPAQLGFVRREGICNCNYHSERLGSKLMVIGLQMPLF